MMKTIKTILNLAISASGLWLVARLLYTYNNPITVGALFILLICARCCAEVIHDLS